MSDNGQAEAEPAMMTREAGLRLPETLEELRQEFGGDTAPAVGHGDPRVRLRALQAHVDPPARRGELDGVRDQVPEDLLQARRVAQDGAGERLQRRRQRQALALGGAPHDVHRHLEDRRQLDELEVERELAADDP